MAIPQETTCQVILNDKGAIFAEMAPWMSYTIRCHHCPLPTAQLAIAHFFHPFFLFISHTIQNLRDFRIYQLYGFIVWVLRTAANAKTVP